MRSILDLPAQALKALIFLYAYAISPLMGAKCRFFPTCSAYAMEALDRHGLLKGTALALLRLSRCHPWHKGKMLDPVPASIAWRTLIGYKSGDGGQADDCGCGHVSKQTPKKD